MMSKGLAQEEAVKRLASYGYNELPGHKQKTFLRIIADVIKEPMFLLLLACTALYLILGEPQEGIIIASSIVLIVSISIYQNRRTEKALNALKRLTDPFAHVLRDGQIKKIPGREIVVGDIILIKEGDRIPADAALFSSRNLEVDESLLTGESVPVSKNDLFEDTTSEKKTQEIYSGTLAVRGKGSAQVTAIGSNTKIGKIGKSIENVKVERTDLQNEIRTFIRKISIVGVVLCVIITMLYTIVRGSLLNGILSGLALSIALLPEEFPVVYTIFMAMGAWRIAKKNVVTRNPSAIEALGTITTLCVDKTGTITQNKMTVNCLSTGSGIYKISNEPTDAIPEEYHQIIEYGILASHADPFDPMEKAIIELGRVKLKETEHIHEKWTVIKEYPLSPGLLAMSRVYPVDSSYLVAVKGAPEAISDLCHLTGSEREAILLTVKEMASTGLRVLAVAHGVYHSADLPTIQHDFDLRFCGLIGLADPIRNEIPEAVKQCYDAGIRVLMVTGDYPVTAQNIAKQIGLHNNEEVLTGEMVANMNKRELAGKLQTVNIFARIAPEQKLAIVKVLKSQGEIVAMTGDGVNDAPALKRAHVGIAMGERGTDVARESSSLVLLDDNFASIVEAIKLGRRIFDNIQKAWTYVLAIHIPIIGFALAPVFFSKMPLILMPAHIVFMELIIDPVSSIVFENEREDKGIMKRKPRSSKHKFFSKKRIMMSITNGLSVFVVTLAVSLLAMKLGFNDDQVRGLTFPVLIMSNLLLALSNLSSHSILKTIKNPSISVKLVMGAALLILVIIVFVPFFRSIFHLQLFPAQYFVVAIASSILSISWIEMLKQRKLIITQNN